MDIDSGFWIIIVFLSLLAFVVLSCILCYIYFMLKDSDKLQSEEYQIRMRQIDIIHEKGLTSPLVEIEAEIEANPGRGISPNLKKRGETE